MDSAYYDPDQFDNVDGREVIDMHGLALQVEEEQPLEKPLPPEAVKMSAVVKFPILAFFAYDHLPKELAEISEPFCKLAYEIANRPTKAPAELAAGLRKLLEAKDCAVRAAL